MNWYQTSIRGQLLKAIMLTSGLVLLLAAAALVAYELVSLRRSMAEHLTSLAHAIAENCTGALAFENRSEARQVLASLQDEPHLQTAAVYDLQGKVFASFLKGKAALPPQPGPMGYRFDQGSLEVVHPVARAGNRLGTLYLRSDLGAINQHMGAYGLIALGVVAASLLAGLLLSSQLQQVISTPVLALAQAARTVTERKDYSVRVQKLSGGELGLLTEAFNRMLEEIQQRQRALRQANQQAEQRAQEAEKGRRLLAALMDNINEGITITGGPPDFPVILV
ncbi:MAG TPA: CHASE sensor domain-containing protein, partial [Candidatus Sulfotelmatobacter sp.]|nr:CHASE sensor domain-containing protein [Candidatus Sulfotelmatobacter sp.]